MVVRTTEGGEDEKPAEDPEFPEKGLIYLISSEQQNKLVARLEHRKQCRPIKEPDDEAEAARL